MSTEHKYNKNRYRHEFKLQGRRCGQKRPPHEVTIQQSGSSFGNLEGGECGMMLDKGCEDLFDISDLAKVKSKEQQMDLQHFFINQGRNVEQDLSYISNIEACVRGRSE